MAEPLRAVFLSYASQDADAVRRICEALRAAGIEVWFDQSELRGGDAWDAAIRKQIKACSLFIPIISKNSHERGEGYFRLEWKLAVDRSHLMAANLPFLVPVVIDATDEADDRVPDRFREVQWTRLPAGVTSSAFVERVSGLLSRKPSSTPAEVRSPDASAAPHVAAAPRQAAAFARWARPLPIVVASIAIIGVSYFALDRFVLSKRPAVGVEVAAPTAVAISRPNTIPEKSIAVLPFADMSEKKDQAYFSDGLAEQILNELARIPALKVIGRASSFLLKDKAEDLRELGRTLGAIYVLEGSVRRAGNQIRVTAQLIDTRDGSHRWSQAYDRNSGNVLQLQEEIATAIARVLQVSITDYFKQQYITRSPEAFDFYLRGIRDLDLGTQESTRRALTEFERAAQLDPQYAAAVIGLAFTYNTRGGNGDAQRGVPSCQTRHRPRAGDRPAQCRGLCDPCADSGQL